jgi:glyoxylase-like metal-dependent hydrolase (beta-lactamase superfamily II)
MPQPSESLSFERNFAPSHGIAEELSPLITRVVCSNPGPFTFTGTATFLIGRRTLAVIDPGPEDNRHLDALIAAIGARRVSHILITHRHMDHSPLAHRLKAITGAKTAGFPVPVRENGAPPAVGLDAARDRSFSPDIALKDGDAIEGEDWRLDAVFTPGHTSDHMAYALAQEKSLFSGDHVMAWSTSVIAPPDGKMGQYLKSLERLLEREDEVYFPTHGPPRRKPKELVRGLIAHRRMREGALLARLKEGPKSVSQLVASLYADVDQALHAAAAQTTLAHLEHLIELGKVQRAPQGPPILYRLS